MKKYLLLICLLMFTISCQKPIHKVSKLQLGTISTISIRGDDEGAYKAIASAFVEIDRIERMMSPYLKTSDIYRINDNAGKKSIHVSPETAQLLVTAREISKLTDGAFDISFESIAHLWDYKKKNFTPPTDEKIQSLLHLVNYKAVIVNDNMVTILVPGMKISLGGIAKGYAIKRAVAVLKKKGVTSGIVEIGGDLQVIGMKGLSPWVTGLRHPRKKDLLLLVKLKKGDSIATSGDYERYKKKGKKRYHHIINPATGKPARTFMSLSVISKDPVLSDACATGLFVAGMKGVRSFIQTKSAFGIIAVDLKGRVYATRNLKSKIDNFNNIKIVWLGEKS